MRTVRQWGYRSEILLVGTAGESGGEVAPTVNGSKFRSVKKEYAAEVKLRAERKAGELLGQLKRAPAGRPAENTRQPVGNFSEYRQTLEETSVEERTAQRWQTVATVPAEVKLRAERKAGELLGQLERDKPGPRTELNSRLESNSEYRTVLTESNVAPVTAHRWQTVARALRN